MLASIPQKLQIEFPYHPLLGICSKELKADTQNDIFIPMFRAISFTTAEASIDGEMDKQNVVYAYMEYYSFFTRKGILTHSTLWIKPGQSVTKGELLCDSTSVRFLD